MKHMLVSQEAIMLEKLQCARYCKQDYGGPLCMRMLENIIATAISVRERERRYDEMKCR